MLIRYTIARKEKFEIESGRHRFDSLLITLSGEFLYTADHVTRRILPYQPVVFKKGIAFHKSVIHPIEYMIISPAEFHHEGSWYLSYDESDRARLENTVAHLKEAILEEKEDGIIEHYFRDILLTAREKTETIPDRGLSRVCGYIQQHYNSRISVADLAQLYGCSVQALIGKFKRHYGKTPARYLTEVRLRKARELLLNTDHSVAEISERCGYENVYYFSNAFKKETGIAPLYFRQGYRI